MRQCHVPRCKGPPTAEGKNEICDICKKAFGSRRGLSTHEMLMHPTQRNEKRAKSATNRETRGPNKGYGTLWLKEEVDITIRLEKSLQGHLQMAKQMMKHLQGKTAKQIRDKRKEPSYKALVEQHASTHESPATPEPHESICSSSDSETEARPVYTRRYVSETEDELLSDGGEVSRKPSPSSLQKMWPLPQGSPQPTMRKCRYSHGRLVMGPPSTKKVGSIER